MYLFEVRIGVAGLVAPVDGNAKKLVRPLKRNQLCSHVDVSAPSDVLIVDHSLTKGLRTAGRWR